MHTDTQKPTSVGVNIGAEQDIFGGEVKPPEGLDQPQAGDKQQTNVDNDLTDSETKGGAGTSGEAGRLGGIASP